MGEPPRVLKAKSSSRRRFTVFGIDLETVGVDYVSASDSTQARQLVTGSHDADYKLVAVFRGYLKPLWHDIGSAKLVTDSTLTDFLG